MPVRLSKPKDNLVKKMVIEELFKRMKVKGDATKMKGGASAVDYVAKQKNKKLTPEQRKELIKMLNDFIRSTKKHQKGGGIIEDLFTGKSARKWWSGFKKGWDIVWKPAMKVVEPLASTFVPEIGVPLTIANKTFGLT